MSYIFFCIKEGYKIHTKAFNTYKQKPFLSFILFGNKVLYTHQKMKKSKVWQDGILKITHLGNKVSAKQWTKESKSWVLLI